MDILAKPKQGPNPRNGQLYRYLGEICEGRVDPYTARRVLTGRYKILHIHWPDRIFYWKMPIYMALFALWLMLLAAKLRGTKVVYTCHNFFPKNKASRKTLRLYFAILRGGVDGVIAPRADLVGRISKIFPDRPVKFIPLGILDVTEDRTPEIFRKLSIENLAGNFILIPGIQERTKKTEKSVAKLRHLCPDVSVLVAGNFPEADYYDDLQKEFGADTKVKICPGFLSEAELATLAENARFIVASQLNGSNSGIALLSVALNKYCFCATSSLARAVRRDYETDLVWPIGDVQRRAPSGNRIDEKKKPPQYSMRNVAAMTLDFFRTL